MTGLEGTVALVAAGGAVREQRANVRSHLRLLTSAADHDPDVVALDRGAPPRAEHAATSIRVLVAAGQALTRARYRSLLETDGAIEVVAEAASGRYAPALAKRTASDVAVLDIEELADRAHPDTITAVVSGTTSAGAASLLVVPPGFDERIVSMLRAGAAGVLSKDAAPADLTRAVRVLSRGQVLFPAGAVGRLLAELPARPTVQQHAARRLAELSDREREVVALVAMGLSNSEIAERLIISRATAKTHVSRAMVKVNAKHRAQLVVLAYQAGVARGPNNAPRGSGFLRSVG
jgi:DNA-binding NarL/FixJ family response regulator